MKAWLSKWLTRSKYDLLAIVPGGAALVALSDYGWWGPLLGWLVFWASVDIRDHFRDRRQRKPTIYAIQPGKARM